MRNLFWIVYISCKVEPLVSAIIITHNRAKYLKKAIQSLINQSIPKHQYEIIVVDNCSSDCTKEVVEEFSIRNNVQYLYEPVLGSSKSRNTGLNNARGKYVAFLDDDAISSSEWLEKILFVFETLHPRPGCVGGKVEPIWESDRPDWLSDELLLALAIINWSDNPHIIDDLKKEWLVSANIAFPIDVVKEVGGFNTSLGRFGKNLLSNEDIFLERQIIKKGYACYYYPDIVVKHHIFQSRLSQSFFIRRYYWQGISNAVMQLIEDDQSQIKRLINAASRTKYFLGRKKNIRRILLPTNKPAEFTQRCWAFVTLGEISGFLRGTKQ